MDKQPEVASTPVVGVDPNVPRRPRYVVDMSTPEFQRGVERLGEGARRLQEASDLLFRMQLCRG